MGNWKTVNIYGKMDSDEAKELIEFLDPDSAIVWNDEPCDCLSFTDSMCGIGRWVKEDGTIYARGNLAERDFDNDDIEAALAYLSEHYPSMDLVLHSGGDFESLECTATFHVKNGEVKREPPEIDHLAWP